MMLKTNCLTPETYLSDAKKLGKIFDFKFQPNFLKFGFSGV